jgi:hypothetical protein
MLLSLYRRLKRDIVLQLLSKVIAHDDVQTLLSKHRKRPVDVQSHLSLDGDRSH